VQLGDDVHLPDAARGTLYREAQKRLEQTTAQLFGTPGAPFETEDAE
jgi:hypothetical protein